MFQVAKTQKCGEVNFSVVNLRFVDDVLFTVQIWTCPTLVVFCSLSHSASTAVADASLIYNVNFVRMISTFVKNTPWRFERFALRTMLRVSSRLHLTLQLDASVSWKWRRVLVYRWFHWNFQLPSGVLNNGVQFFNLVKKNIMIFCLLVCCFCLVFQYLLPALLSFEQIWRWMTTLLAKLFLVSM